MNDFPTASLAGLPCREVLALAAAELRSQVVGIRGYAHLIAHFQPIEPTARQTYIHALNFHVTWIARLLKDDGDYLAQPSDDAGCRALMIRAIADLRQQLADIQAKAAHLHPDLPTQDVVTIKQGIEAACDAMHAVLAELRAFLGKDGS